MQLIESLRAGDLEYLVKKVFGIDAFKSKIGDDDQVVVVSFEVKHEDAAKDLENFIEMGYSFVLDADCTAGETDDGSYFVFVELERGRHVAEEILEILAGVKKLANLDHMRFRYFKNFKSQDANVENINIAVPQDKDSYEIATKRNTMDNFQEFFKNSYADEIKLIDESISFSRPYSGTVTFNILNSGNKQEVYDSVRGPIVLESKDMAEVMFLTKVIGNYNINKISNTFIFENGNWAVALERK
jgi:RNase H-fold protein (predicted Holliday junction resolvase)